MLALSLIALGELVLIGLLVVTTLRTSSLWAERLAKREDEWTLERAELLNRIQRPEMLPTRTTPREPQEPPKDAEALSHIGLAAPYREE